MGGLTKKARWVDDAQIGITRPFKESLGFNDHIITLNYGIHALRFSRKIALREFSANLHFGR